MIFDVLAAIVDELDLPERSAMLTGHGAPQSRKLFTNKHIVTIFILVSQTCNTIHWSKWEG